MCVSVCHMNTWCPQRSERASDALELELYIDGCIGSPTLHKPRVIVYSCNPSAGTVEPEDRVFKVSLGLVERKV